MESREHLKQFLIAELDSAVEQWPPDKALIRVLYLAIEGLENLDFGQTDEIFAAAKTGKWGVHPATAIRYQARAIGYVLLLKEMGFSVGEAEAKVAEGYGIEANLLHQWRKTLGINPEQPLRGIMDRAVQQFRNLKRLGHAPSAQGVLGEIKKAGQAYQTARTTKSVKKPV